MTTQHPGFINQHQYRDILVRIGASKIRQDKEGFQASERDLKQRCSETLGSTFEAVYEAPTEYEDIQATKNRRKRIRRRLKKYDEEQERIRQGQAIFQSTGGALNQQCSELPDRGTLIRIGAAKIRQGREAFQVSERELKQQCSKTVGSKLETVYENPAKDEDRSATQVRRRWMRRMLKK